MSLCWRLIAISLEDVGFSLLHMELTMERIGFFRILNLRPLCRLQVKMEERASQTRLPVTCFVSMTIPNPRLVTANSDGCNFSMPTLQNSPRKLVPKLEGDSSSVFCSLRDSGAIFTCSHLPSVQGSTRCQSFPNNQGRLQSGKAGDSFLLPTAPASKEPDPAETDPEPIVF